MNWSGAENKSIADAYLSQRNHTFLRSDNAALHQQEVVLHQTIVREAALKVAKRERIISKM